jgi:hypothetical protein
MKNLILLLFVCLISNLFAQNSNESKPKTNIVKIGASTMALFTESDDIRGYGGLGISLEHGLGKHGSFSVNIDHNRNRQKLSTQVTATTLVISIEPDFRFYFLKGMKGIYLGIGMSYHQFKAKIDKETIISYGLLGTGIKLGFQTHINDRISLHVHTGLGIIADDDAVTKIPLGIQAGYRF